MRRELLLITVILFTISLQSQNFKSVTTSNDGQTINLGSDQVLEIKLPFNPSTGYEWIATSMNKDVIAQAGDWDFIPNKYNGAAGQPGTEVIRLIGASEGTSELTLEYKRPWEKDKSSLDVFKITLKSAGKYTGTYTPTIKTIRNKSNKREKSNTSLPSSFSWQSKCTLIKDQGDCGCCWAFAATGCFEAILNILDQTKTSMSEQWLINCDSKADGCQGSTTCPNNFWVSPGGVYESELTYADASCNLHDTTLKCIGTCGTYTYHQKADSHFNFNDMSPTDAQMKAAIYDYGPLWVTIYAGKNFLHYTHGVVTTSEGSIPNHAVVIVGWKDSTAISTGGYWIIRNSWGTLWGEQGYMRMAYDINAIGTNADYIVYKGGIPCSGTPNPGNTISSVNPLCSSASFTLSLQNATNPVNGLTYQWQSSLNNSTWTNITGANEASYTTTQKDTTYYRCDVTCSGSTGTSVSLKEKIIATPAPPIVKSPILYCLGATPSTLTATGSNLTWFLYGTGGSGSTIAPTPTTVKADTVSYYVAQTATDGCQSPRAEIQIIIKPLPTTPIISQTGNELVITNNSTGLTYRWYNQDGQVAGATSSSYTPTKNGTFYVLVTKNSCLSDASNKINFKLAGIIELSNSEYLNIYPNPVTNELIIESTKDVPLNIVLTNIIGQSISSTILNKKTIINMSNLAKGMYLLKIFNEKDMLVKKILKE